MGKASVVGILLVCILVPSAPLASAECVGEGIARACAEQTPTGARATASNVLVPTEAGAVPANFVYVSANTTGDAYVNATSKMNGWRWSVNATESHARVCGFAVVVGSSWVNFGCTDPNSPPDVSTDPDAWVDFVTGIPSAVLGALPCRLSGRTIVCEG